MSDETKATPSDPLYELAGRIYVELVGRAFLRVENAAVFKPSPQDLAKLSIELAAAFQNAEKESKAAAGPKNIGYDIKMSDMEGWVKS